MSRLRSSRLWILAFLALFPADGFAQDPAEQQGQVTATAGQGLRLCADVPPNPNTGVLFGAVLDAGTAQPIPGSQVHLYLPAAEGNEGEDAQIVEAQTDTHGQYAYCNVPRETELRVVAAAFGKKSYEAPVILGGSSLFKRHDVNLFLTRIDGGIAGNVVDAETGDPIAGATASIPNLGAGVLTDERGAFLLDHLPPGDATVQIHHIAYGDPTLTVRVKSGSITHVELQIPRTAIELEPIAITIETRPKWLERNGFYTRLNGGLGQFLTPEQIERRGAIRFSELLRAIPGVQITRLCVPHCYYKVIMSTNQRLMECGPVWYVDGRKMWMDIMDDVDAVASAFDIQAIEVYRGVSQTPPQFFGQCGSIVVWTKRGTTG